MSDSKPKSAGIDSGNLKHYFYQSLTEISERRNLDSNDSSMAYIINLLCDYARSDQLFDWDQENGYDVRPLALLYGDAVQTTDANHRALVLRRLGDVALFISGMFNASLTRKPVDVNYYINMGGGAYHWLSQHLETDSKTSLNPEVFRDLSERFGDYVNLLDEFTDNTELRGDKDVVKLYQLWLENNESSIADKMNVMEGSVRAVDNQMVH